MTVELQPADEAVRLPENITSFLRLDNPFSKYVTGLDFIKYCILENTMSGIKTTRSIEEIIDMSGLSENINQGLHTYSSGMLLRIKFCVAFSKKTDILIMDEWLSVGDDGFKEKARNEINRQIKESQAFVIATHSKKLLQDYCNIAVVLHKGEINFIGEPNDAVQRYNEVLKK